MLANFYAQVLGSTFVEQQKPYEVELCLAGVGATADADELYRITYDGSITDEPQFVVMGGTTDPISAKLKDTYRAGLDLAAAIGIAVEGLQAGPAARRRQRGGGRAGAGRVGAGGRGARPGPAAAHVPPDRRPDAARAAPRGQPGGRRALRRPTPRAATTPPRGRAPPSESTGPLRSRTT